MRKITFLKTMMLAVILLAGSGSVWGQVTLPHHEPINYTVGQALQTQSGWTTLNSGDDLLIASGSLSLPGLVASSGNKVTFDGAGIDAAKLFTQQTSGTIYYSFLLNVTALGTLSTTGGYLTGFTEGTGTTFGATVWTRSDGTGFDIGINPRTTAANTVWSSGTTSLNSTLFIVVSYEIVAGATNDIVKMWINPTPGSTEPTATLSATNGLADLANINRILLRQDNATNTPFVEMDELRIGTTWADVTPSSGSSSCTTSSLAFANPVVNKIATDLPFTITPTTNSTGAISYLSSLGTVASVNNTTGEVTIAGAGTTVITANQAADATYCANSVTYTLNVASASPTITITEVTAPAFSAEVGSTDTETINVSGANLTANIILTIDGANANMFSVNSPLSSTGGVATIIYTPTAPGTHTATLRLNSTGAAEETRTLSGTATLATPVATDANGISQSGFTANWNAVSGATGYELSVYTKTIQTVNATDLFISEYIEGLSFNKAIEIFNGTGAPIDLSIYSLRKQSNGAGAYSGDFPLTGTLANNAVHVVAHSSANASILALANQTIGASPVDFNGNDAVGLFKNGTQIDEVGVFNQTTNWGTDVTLIRNSIISAPKVPYDAGDWNSLATDNISNLGSHTMTGSGLSATQITGSPFTVTGDISRAITGLSPLTTYYYTVVAINGTNRSVVSNEIMVTTSPSTALDNLNGNVSVSALNGNVVFNAAANLTVEIFTAAGQRIVRKNTVEGLNSIPVTQKGVMLVKVGNQVSKVIM